MDKANVKLKAIAFDADDTLWHTENLFQETQLKLATILQRYAPSDIVDEKLYLTEKKNINLFGFGVKGFTLSMVETAIEISDGLISAYDIHAIIMQGKKMLSAPLVLLENTEDILKILAKNYDLYLITKGGMLDQNNKINQSGLEKYFKMTQVVVKKDKKTYQNIFDEIGVKPHQIMMVGNSIPSDVIPVIDIGGYGVHIPYETTALHERYDNEPISKRFFSLKAIDQLPKLITMLNNNG